MSWSLQLTNGDLAIGTNGLNTVTGASKLTQDLRCYLLTPTGTDPLHLTYGSIMDGGTDPSGNPVPGIIGQPNNNAAVTFIGGEVRRVCQAYQASQIARNATDVATYGKSTLTADEALLSVEGITIQQVTTQALVTATLQTGTGNQPLAIPFSTN